MTKKLIIGLILMTALLLIAPAAGMAEWNVSIGIGVPLPGFYYYAAPPVAIVPAPTAPLYGVVAPAPGSAYFFGSLWYRLSGGQWFIAAEFGGPWSSIAAESVPPEVYGAPVYQGAGQGTDGRYIPPRLYYGGEE